MIVQLQPGDRLTIRLEATDGEFVVSYGERTLSITADMPDSDGRVGLIYEERFAEEHEKFQAVHGGVEEQGG